MAAIGFSDISLRPNKFAIVNARYRLQLKGMPRRDSPAPEQGE
jgi:hypothetical protein